LGGSSLSSSSVSDPDMPLWWFQVSREIIKKN
jgi:hypothetical protein